MVDSPIIQCPVCGQFRHKSHFHVGRRGCAECYEEGRLWERETDRLYKKLSEQERNLVKSVIYDWMMHDTFPEEITAQERKILLLRTQDMKSLDESARVMGIKLKRAAHIEQQAQSKLARLAKQAMPGWVAARN